MSHGYASEPALTWELPSRTDKESITEVDLEGFDSWIIYLGTCALIGLLLAALFIPMLRQ